MTTAELISYYSGLLIIQYRSKPKAKATIEASVGPVVTDQLPALIQDSYDLSTAIGVQLDVLGKYAGVTRYGYGIGGSQITLGDSDFRTLIKLAVLKNNSGSSLYDIQTLIEGNFHNQILVFDHSNMQMSYYLNSTIGSQNLGQVFVTSGLLPKPMGVEIGSIIYSSDIFRFFGMRTYGLAGYNVTGFNSYSSYQTDRPWLSYTNALTA
jgi:hypothetical protein